MHVAVHEVNANNTVRRHARTTNKSKGKTMRPDEIEACWKDPHSYKCGVYYCKTDPRVIVPRRFKWMGWTINFARPSAIPVLLGMVALMVVPVGVVRASGGGTVVSYFTTAASIAVVCLLSAYLSSSTRWSH